MKKGCFISVVIILTVVVMAIFYLFKFYGNDILELGKDKVLELAEYKIFNDLDNIDNLEYADSIKIVIENYFDNIDVLEIENQVEKIEELTDNMEVILKDSRIDSLEFDFIKTILIKND